MGAELDRVTVRHNVDGNRGKRVLARLGIAYAVPTSSTTLDEVAFKMIISDSAKRQRHLTKADVKSAWGLCRSAAACASACRPCRGACC